MADLYPSPIDRSFARLADPVRRALVNRLARGEAAPWIYLHRKLWNAQLDALAQLLESASTAPVGCRA